MEFTKTVLGPRPQPNLQRVPDGFQRVPTNAFDNGFEELVVLYRASLHLHGFRNGFQRVPDGFQRVPTERSFRNVYSCQIQPH